MCMFFRFVKTCLQLASSCECNMEVRHDHFDQMLSMIRSSNIGKLFKIKSINYIINTLLTNILPKIHF